MAFVKILFSILVSLPILVLGCWLFGLFFKNIFSKNENENDTVDRQTRRN